MSSSSYELKTSQELKKLRQFSTEEYKQVFDSIDKVKCMQDFDWARHHANY